MSQISSLDDDESSNSRKRASETRIIKHSLKIDMTPMVDLGFLLISFFVITAELSKPTVMDLVMPKDGPPLPLKESGALTLLLGKGNVVFYYEGMWEEAIKKEKIFPVHLAGANSLRELINQKQKRLEKITNNKEGRNRLMLLIKPGNEATYKLIIDVLDETSINLVTKYALIKQSNEEMVWLKNKL